MNHGAPLPGPKKVYTMPAPRRYKPRGDVPPPEQAATTTKYVHMLLSLDNIPAAYNLLSSVFTWILLAGYVLFPGTFTTIREKGPEGRNDAERWILDTMKNAPLLWVAVICTGVGTLGMLGLWARWRKNYIWVANRIFLPGFLNSLAGMISTITNVVTAQEGIFSTTAIVSITLTATSTVVNGALWAVYTQYMIKRLQEEHHMEFGYSLGKRKNASEVSV